MPKGEERRIVVEHISASGGGFVVVKDRQLADRAWDGDGQFAAGVHVAEEHIGEGLRALLAQIPAFEQRIQVFGGVAG